MRPVSVVTSREEIFASRDDGMGQGIVCGDITEKESLWRCRGKMDTASGDDLTGRPLPLW